MNCGDSFENMSPTCREVENWPSVEIIEQPARRLRFRYASEEAKMDSIQGVNSKYPKIRINHAYGPIVVVVSCVTADSPYKVHPHGLCGPGTRDGFLVGRPSGNEFELDRVGIQRVDCSQVDQAFHNRSLARVPELGVENQDFEVDPFGYGFDHAKDIDKDDMHAVRLAFHVFIQNNQGIWESLEPIISKTIFDANVPYDPMRIRYLSNSSGIFAGGETVIVELNNKVEQSTEVVFFLPGADGECKWQSRAEIMMVRRNTLVFKTPPYERIISEDNVEAFFVVRRSSDNLCSAPCAFQYRIKHQVMHPYKEAQKFRVDQMPMEEDEQSINLNSALGQLSI